MKLRDNKQYKKLTSTHRNRFHIGQVPDTNALVKTDGCKHLVLDQGEAGDLCIVILNIDSEKMN